MHRLETAWNCFWFGKVDGLSLGLLRVGFAAATLWLCLGILFTGSDAMRLELRRLIAAR